MYFEFLRLLSGDVPLYDHNRPTYMYIYCCHVILKGDHWLASCKPRAMGAQKGIRHMLGLYIDSLLSIFYIQALNKKERMGDG